MNRNYNNNMKFLIALLVFVYGTLSSCTPVERAIQNVGAAPTVTSSVGFVGGEWLANFKCDFSFEPDCSLSVHANGRRIDGANHAENEEIFLSCISSSVAIDYVIHGFLYSDIQDYSCLHDTRQDLNSAWLTPSPIIETTGEIVHGQPASFTCNAPSGTPVFWILPGPTSDHQSAVVTNTDNGVNSTSTLTFTVQDSDHFSTYNCCIGIKDNQPPYSSSCSSYTISDSEKIGIVSTTADYDTLRYKMTAEVKSYPLPDPITVKWQQCVTEGQCGDVDSFYYTVDSDLERFTVSSHFEILQDSTYTSYTFQIDNSDKSAQYNATFVTKFNDFSPRILQQPSQIFVNPDDGSTAVTMKFIVEANPQPTLSFFKQNINSQSLGREPISTDGHYAIDITQSEINQWIATVLINPYNVDDNAIYIVEGENVNGASQFNSDTTYGPVVGSLSLTRDLNATGYAFDCSFNAFPNPSKYEINVVAPYSTDYTIASETFDPLYEKTSVKINVSSDAQNTFFQIICSAYHPYDETKSQTRSLLINTA
ncbi:hypothetical protein CHUAL_007443 [Chamberlinius hualienensis]